MSVRGALYGNTDATLPNNLDWEEPRCGSSSGASFPAGQGGNRAGRTQNRSRVVLFPTPRYQHG